MRWLICLGSLDGTTFCFKKKRKKPKQVKRYNNTKSLELSYVLGRTCFNVWGRQWGKGQLSGKVLQNLTLSMALRLRGESPGWSLGFGASSGPRVLRCGTPAQGEDLWREGQKRQELDHGAQSIRGHSLVPPCSFPSGKHSQTPPAARLSGIWVHAQSLMKTERAQGGHPQRADLAK